MRRARTIAQRGAELCHGLGADGIRHRQGALVQVVHLVQQLHALLEHLKLVL
jgi:hypothetical protein